jgi:transposase
LSTKIKATTIRKDFEDKSREEILDELVDKILEIEKLKRKLRKHENPHTPSSKQGFDKPKAQGLRVGRKPGKKYDHPRTTRPKEKPNQPVIIVTTTCNPKTGNTNIKKTGMVLERTITDIKFEKTVTPYQFIEYVDLTTGEKFYAQHPDVPEVGIFGKNIITFANFLHFEHRVTLRGVADIFTHPMHISMSATTVQELCNRGTKKSVPVYESIKKEIQTAKVVNADETGSNQNGQPAWLWGFFTPFIALLIFCEERGGPIVSEVLKDFNGILGCDGWGTYKKFSREYGILLQRCWAHLIREVKSLCKGVPHLDNAYTWICDMFEEIQRLRTLKTLSIRKKGYNKLLIELQQWISLYEHNKEMKTLIKKVKNGKDHWFTCVLYPEVEPTNNLAEQGLRKFVIIRKIIGCLRSDEGKLRMQTMLSVFQTWRLQNRNPYQELRALL